VVSNKKFPSAESDSPTSSRAKFGLMNRERLTENSEAVASQYVKLTLHNPQRQPYAGPVVRRRPIVLTDPRALRAFAHPARQAIMQELLHGRVMTATEAAELVGLSPSAVSHHMRALEKWGLAERVTDGGDGRERPWRGTGTRINLNPGGSAPNSAAVAPLAAQLLGRLSEEVAAYLDAMADEPWRDIYSGISRAELWLTEEETRRVGQALEAAVAPYAGRHAAEHPENARRTAITFSMIPLSPAPTEE
jgi:DNA-binding transcriptional ArsR family regulator